VSQSHSSADAKSPELSSCVHTANNNAATSCVRFGREADAPIDDVTVATTDLDLSSKNTTSTSTHQLNSCSTAVTGNPQQVLLSMFLQKILYTGGAAVGQISGGVTPTQHGVRGLCLQKNL